jgi:ABC-type lipoprotein release transport system permease subunit
VVNVIKTNLRGLVFTSLRSLMMHKLRSFLTILGLVFGVASVIVMLAVAEGASRAAQEQIELLGVNNVIVRSLKTQHHGAYQLSFVCHGIRTHLRRSTKR